MMCETKLQQRRTSRRSAIALSLFLLGFTSCRGPDPQAETAWQSARAAITKSTSFTARYTGHSKKEVNEVDFTVHWQAQSTSLENLLKVRKRPWNQRGARAAVVPQIVATFKSGATETKIEILGEMLVFGPKLEYAVVLSDFQFSDLIETLIRQEAAKLNVQIPEVKRE